MKSLTIFSLKALAVSCGLLVLSQTSQAQNQVFFEDWETDHSLDGTYKTNYTTGGANLADLYFDYSTVGIPLSPHSSGGTTRALKMAANLSSTVQVFPSGVSVSPVGFGITENFDMRFDAWFNFNGPAPAGGSGSTQVGGAGYGTAGTTAQVAGTADSVFIGGTADGGSSADYRVYSPGHQIAYQDGSYRIGSSGTVSTILGDPTTGYVYNSTNGSRNNTAAPFPANFPGQSPPAAQTELYPQQTGTAANGSLAFKWHEVSLRKVANIITYSIDGFLIATVDVTDAGTLGGTNILFNHYDINAGASTDPNRTNLIFTLIDNVRITNFANVVSVVTATTNVTEGSPSAGIFTVTRTSSGVPVTVAYTMSGAAINGVDYTNAAGAPLSGTVTFCPSCTSTNITVIPVDDAIPELTESITMSIDASPDYIGAGTATINIVDNESPQLTTTNVSKQMYERTNDYATFKISRLGSTNAASFGVNLSFASSTATMNVDYYTNTTVRFEPGAQSVNLKVYPIQDGLYEGNETVTVAITAADAAEYTIGAANSATITLVDADGPEETVLFSENFNVDNSGNWTLLFGATNSLDPDYTVIWAFDYSGQNIPPAPHGNGDTLGLFMTVNKDATLSGVASAAALNLYPNFDTFSGNYALRFDMFLNMIPGGNSTEYALFGINHSGTKTNWWRSGGVPAGWEFDGIFYAVETDAQTSPNFVNYSSPATSSNNPAPLTAGVNSSAFTDAFKSNPWIVAGSPAMSAPSNTPVWADVELSQVGNILTLTINHTKILSYTNSTAYTDGRIMIGYLDAFDSLGSIQNYIIYDNVRVVSLAAPVITAISLNPSGSPVTVDFQVGDGDQVGQFVLQASTSVTGPYTDMSSTITVLQNGPPKMFRATKVLAPTGSQMFFRVRRAG